MTTGFAGPRKLKDIVSFSDFNPPIDGTSSSQTAWSNFLNHCFDNDAQGFVNDGIYVVTDEVVLGGSGKNGQHLSLIGSELAIIKTTENLDGVIQVTGSNPEVDASRQVGGVTIRFLNIRGPYAYGGSKQGKALRFDGVQAIKIDDCEMRGFDTGLYLHNTDVVSLNRNFLHDNNFGIDTSGTGYAANSGQCNTFRCRDNRFAQNGTGLRYVGGTGAWISFNEFIGNTTCDVNLSNTSESTHVTVQPVCSSNYHEDSVICYSYGGGNGIVRGGITTGNVVIASSTTLVFQVNNVDNAGSKAEIKNNNLSGTSGFTIYSIAGGSAANPELDTGVLFDVRVASDQSITAQTETKVNLDTVVRNTGRHGTYDTTNKRFTPAVNGFYRFTFNGMCETTGNAGDRYAYYVYKSGTAHRIFGGGTSSTSTDTSLSAGTLDMYLASSDYAEIYTYFFWGATLSGGDDRFTTRLQIEYLGAT